MLSFVFVFDSQRQLGFLMLEQMSHFFNAIFNCYFEELCKVHFKKKQKNNLDIFFLLNNSKPSLFALSTNCLSDFTTQPA